MNAFSSLVEGRQPRLRKAAATAPRTDEFVSRKHQSNGGMASLSPIFMRPTAAASRTSGLASRRQAINCGSAGEWSRSPSALAAAERTSASESESAAQIDSMALKSPPAASDSMACRRTRGVLDFRRKLVSHINHPRAPANRQSVSQFDTARTARGRLARLVKQASMLNMCVSSPRWLLSFTRANFRRTARACRAEVRRRLVLAGSNSNLTGPIASAFDHRTTSRTKSAAITFHDPRESQVNDSHFLDAPAPYVGATVGGPKQLGSPNYGFASTTFSRSSAPLHRISGTSIA